MKKARETLEDTGERVATALVVVALIALFAVVLAAAALGRTSECRH